MNTVTIILFLSSTSLIAGFVDSIAGGGGLIMLPVILLTGITPQTALGTNKFGSTFGTGMALINYIRNQKVIWRLVVSGVIFTLWGSLLGSKTILIFSSRMVGQIIVFLLPLAILTTLTPHPERTFTNELTRRDLLLKVPLICLSIGFYDGFFGPGAGSFLIIAFYELIGLNLLQASATAKAFNLASNISALLVFLLEGKVLLGLGIPLALANMLGNHFGSSCR
jgi:uncharacterized membrane protein YfcA